jgi:hypothetical protein
LAEDGYLLEIHSSGWIKGEELTLLLQGHDRLAYTCAVEALNPSGIALDVAMGDYAMATEFLQGVSNVVNNLAIKVKNHVLGRSRLI